MTRLVIISSLSYSAEYKTRFQIKIRERLVDIEAGYSVAITELLILEDGWLTEKQAHELSAWYVANSPVKDGLAMEANWMAIRAADVILEAGRPESGMTVARYTLLRELFSATDKRMSMSDISHKLHVTMTNVTKLVEGLVALGLVQRIEDDEDKRRTWAHLTPLGEETMRDLIPKTALQIEKTWSVLNPHEKRLLIHLLAKVKLQLQIASGSHELPRLEGLD